MARLAQAKKDRERSGAAVNTAEVQPQSGRAGAYKGKEKRDSQSTVASRRAPGGLPQQVLAVPKSFQKKGPRSPHTFKKGCGQH